MSLVFVLALLVLLTACRQEPLLDEPHAAVAKRDGKVSGDLLALHREYVSHQQGGSNEFHPSNTALMLIGDRVVVDAVAVDDAAALGRALRAIGASEVSVMGRTASAHLPIDAIEDLEGLESLKSIRATYAQPR